MANEVRSIRNNNPGNLRAVDPKTRRKLTQPGYVLDKAVGFDKEGFAVFPDKESGMSAMKRQIKLDTSRGMTGKQMIQKYAPEHENDTGAYISNVFNKSGIDPDKPIDSKHIAKIQHAMIRQEGGKKAAEVYGGVKPLDRSDVVAKADDQYGADDDFEAYKKKVTSAVANIPNLSKALQAAREREKQLAGVAESLIRFKDLRSYLREQVILTEKKK